MAYKLTPYDRRVQAELIRQEREAKFAARNPAAYKKTGAATVAPVQDKKEKNGFVTALHTAGDVGANVVIGAGKGVEGIVDLFVGIGGGIAGLFSSEAQDAVKDFIATDWTNELYGNAWQEGLDQSALNGSKAGEIVEGVAQGVGQMLPAVAVSALTMGAGAPAAVAQLASLGTTVASAAGTGTEEAFGEGASYGKGLAYGAASGAVEGATEKLTGGMGKLFGGGVLDNVLGDVAKVGVKRVAKEAVGEGVEEMISEVAGPALKTIYRGKDALSEYGEGDFWKGVAEAGVIGAGTSVAYGESVGKMLGTTGVNADASAVADHIAEQKRLRDDLEVKGALTTEAEVQIAKNIKADMELLSERLKKASPQTRERILQSPDLALNYDAEGNIRPEIAEQLETDIKNAGDTSSGIDRRYYSATARGREAEIMEGLAAQGTKVYAGELTKEENAAYKKAKEVHKKLKSMGFVNTDLVLAETMADTNAYLDGRTVVIGKDSLADGSYVKHLVHETTHFTEGTMEWLDVMDHVFGKDGSAVKHLIERVKASGYGVTDADVTAVLDAVREGKLKDTKLTDKQQTLVTEVVAMQMEETFGSEDAINRLVGEKPNLAKRIFERIKAFLQTFGKATERDPEAVKQLRRTEELFRKALENAGLDYAVQESLTRMNEKNVQVSEEDAETIDGSGDVRYNDGEVKKSAKIVKYIPYSKVGQGNVDAIRRQLSRLYGGAGDGVANGIAIENGSAVFIVDSSKENGEIRFGVRGKIKISDSNLRAEYIRRTNVEAVSNGYISDELSSRFGDRHDNHRESNLRRESGTEPSADQGKSPDNKGGVSVRDANRGGIKQSRKIIPIEDHEYRDLTDVSDATENHEVAGVLPEGAKIHEHKASPATRFTHRDVNEMLENIRRESLTFTSEDGTEINGKISRRDGWDLDKWLYDTLNTANLKDKRVLAARIADRILATAVTESDQPLRDAVGEDGTALVREDLALSVAALLGDKQAQIENRRINAHFDTMRKIVTEMEGVEKGRFYSATIYDGNTLRAIPNMIRAALKTSRAFTGSIRNTLAKVKDWYCAEDNAMMYKPMPGEHNEGMTDGQIVFDKDIAVMLEQLTTGTGKLSVQELEMVVDIAKHFQKLSERYQRVFFDDKWVDAEQMAQEFVKVMQAAKKDQNWIVRGLLNKYMRQFGDLAALFRAMDAYDPNGFYTKMHEWMRNAAISMQSDELHALREYYEWHEKHKKWAKHLENDMVEFRGEQMTLGQLMTLYCNAKTEKSKQALADNGYKFTDKNGGVHRLKGILYHQKGNSSVKHTREEVQRACKGVENDIWDMLTEEQREYVKLLENVLNTTCRKWKIDTDTLMKGFSRVHERGYYFPTAHNGIAKTVDTTFYEGDRVGHLSLNKDAVEGARGELVIENIDDVVLRHVHNMSLYKNYAIVAENRSMLQNIDVGEVDATGKRVKNVHQAVTIRTTNEEFGKNRGTDMMKLLDKMSNDLQGGRRAGQDEQSFLKDLVEQIRGNYARFQLGLNPKTLATQLSSLIAAGNILEYNCIVRGIKGFGSKKTAQLVDKYCPLAELRNFDNSAALAAGVLETTGKVGDVLMKGIGFVDRRVVCSLFYACQLQVQKDSKLALGTEENLKAAGELLTRVILETQQNSLVTEKSDAMRGGIFSRTFTMFTADGMKVIGRWFDAIGEWAVLSKRYKDAKTDADKARLKKELKRVHGQALRSTSTLAAQAAYMALISYAFRLLYDKDEEEVGENVLQGVWDFLGGLIGGLPIVRDIYSYFTEGYELDNFFLSTINDVLVATGDAVGVASDAISGKDVSGQDVAGAVRKVVYSAGQVFGIPTRNAYNFVTGLTRRIVPTAGYKVDSLFTQKAYTSDIEKAIEAGDENMIETITGLMIDEKIGIEDDAMRKVLQSLTEKGNSVLPRSVGDSVTVDGETVTLTGAQQKKLRSVYAIGQEAVADMVKLKQFQSAGDEVQAAAIKFVYDVYWDLALEDVLGLDLAEKNVLFAEAISIEKLAVIIATARALEADKDKDGKAIAGTKKRKVQTFVNSLHLTAAEKYMVMGYLGYTNVNGESAVKAHIGKLNLSKSEKEKLLGYSGYGA